MIMLQSKQCLELSEMELIILTRTHYDKNIKFSLIIQTNMCFIG